MSSYLVEDRGPQSLKGVREPVTLYRVVQPSGVRSRLDVAAGRLTRFVGREVELAILVVTPSARARAPRTVCPSQRTTTPRADSNDSGTHLSPA